MAEVKKPINATIDPTKAMMFFRNVTIKARITKTLPHFEVVINQVGIKITPFIFRKVALKINV